MAQIRRCFIQCYNATLPMLTELDIPKERAGGSYDIKCMISAFNESSKEAWIYAEFEKVYQCFVMKALEEAGASNITIELFSPIAYARASSMGLVKVTTKASDHGFQLITRGAPSAYVGGASSSAEEIIPIEAIHMLEDDFQDSQKRLMEFEKETKDMTKALEVNDEKIVDLQSKLELKTRHFDEVHTALTVNAQELAALRAETRRKAQVDSARHEKYEDMKVRVLEPIPLFTPLMPRFLATSRGPPVQGQRVPFLPAPVAPRGGADGEAGQARRGQGGQEDAHH